MPVQAHLDDDIELSLGQGLAELRPQSGNKNTARAMQFTAFHGSCSYLGTAGIAGNGFEACSNDRIHADRKRMRVRSHASCPNDDIARFQILNRFNAG